MKIKNIKQTEIAETAGVSDALVSLILSGQRRPSWRVAKRLASASRTKPELWLEGSPDEIREALKSRKIRKEVIASRPDNQRKPLCETHD